MPKGSRAGKTNGAPGEPREGGKRGRQRGWALRAEVATAAPRMVCGKCSPQLQRQDQAGWGDGRWGSGGRPGGAAPVSPALTALPEARGFWPVDQGAGLCSCQGVLLWACREGQEERGLCRL